MKKVTWVSIGVAVAVAVAILGALWFARSGARAPDEWRSLPVYQVLRRHEPEVYARLLEQHEAMRAGRISTAQYTNYANQVISEAATRRLGKASTGAKVALMRDMTDNLARLRARADDACFRYLYPEIAGGADVAGALTPEAQARTLALAGDVIRSSAENPSPPASRAEAAEKLGPIINAVYAEFGSDTTLMSRVREPGIDRHKVCDIALALYQRMLALPPEDAAMVLSAVAASDS